MKIRMLKDQHGSTNGVHISLYESGSVHDLSATQGEIELASAFVAAGMAEPENKQAPAPQNKAAPKPANK